MKNRYVIKIYDSNVLKSANTMEFNNIEYALKMFNELTTNCYTTQLDNFTFDNCWNMYNLVVLIDRKHKEIIKRTNYRHTTEIAVDYESYYVDVYDDLL